ncbi:MAG: serine/threonine protein kinase [Deltaproteobacteria bacterium]|nr:serine/threonine protein kinase [Deltaproteobacteria bacterium]
MGIFKSKEKPIKREKSKSVSTNDSLPRDDYNLAPALAQYGIDAHNKLFDNRYTIGKIVGKGERGFVLAVYDEVGEHDLCALKIIFPHISERPHVYERINRAVMLSSKLKHRNVVGIREQGRDENSLLYYVMDYVPGDSLFQILHEDNYRELSFYQIVYIIRELALALNYAHRKMGIVHRDINPSNILVDDYGNIKLTDFSLARAMEDKYGISETGEVVGKLNYMSPKIFNGVKDYDPSCDFYSLGIVAYELCTGRCPFEIPDWTVIARQNKERKLPKFFGKAKHYPAWFHAFIEKCLSQDEEERFFHGGEMVYLINNYIRTLHPGTFQMDLVIKLQALRGMTCRGLLEKRSWEEK